MAWWQDEETEERPVTRRPSPFEAQAKQSEGVIEAARVLGPAIHSGYQKFGGALRQYGEGMQEKPSPFGPAGWVAEQLGTGMEESSEGGMYAAEGLNFVPFGKLIPVAGLAGGAAALGRYATRKTRGLRNFAADTMEELSDYGRAHNMRSVGRNLGIEPGWGGSFGDIRRSLGLGGTPTNPLSGVSREMQQRGEVPFGRRVKERIRAAFEPEINVYGHKGTGGFSEGTSSVAAGHPPAVIGTVDDAAVQAERAALSPGGILEPGDHGGNILSGAAKVRAPWGSAKRPLTPQQFEDLVSSPEGLKKLQAMGHDGVVFRQESGELAVGVFDETRQFKIEKLSVDEDNLSALDDAYTRRAEIAEDQLEIPATNSRVQALRRARSMEMSDTADEVALLTDMMLTGDVEEGILKKVTPVKMGEGLPDQLKAIRDVITSNMKRSNVSSMRTTRMSDREILKWADDAVEHTKKNPGKRWYPPGDRRRR